MHSKNKVMRLTKGNSRLKKNRKAKINSANLKKTIYYLKRNGLKNTWYAVRERLDKRGSTPYFFTPIEEEVAEQQRRAASQYETRFSIVVPAYRTDKTYLEEMITSVIGQTYPRWELVLADATENDSVETAVRHIAEKAGILVLPAVGCEDKEGAKAESDSAKAGKDRAEAEGGAKWQPSCIRYLRLAENAGIAENTNQGLRAAGGDYIGLLDHDDVLTENALYEMAAAIAEGKQAGVEAKLLYSDEDKCNSDRTMYYEPNFKESFNLDLLLSNNYICHFLVMEAGLMRELGFRQEYNGAQDYDLVLRAAGRLMDREEQLVHIPLVLYHWRCHAASTAENPQSKQYAYDAGRDALQDFADSMGWSASAVPLKHLGFYTLVYRGDILKIRQDLGAVGGRLVAGKRAKTAGGRLVAGKGAEKGSNSFMPGAGARTISGRMSEAGEVFYKDLPLAYSGYLHRAVLTQDAEVLDIRCIQIREELYELFQETTGVSYQKREQGDLFDASLLPEDTDYIEMSIRLSKAIRERGYRLLYLPARTEIWNAGKRRIEQ